MATEFGIPQEALDRFRVSIQTAPALQSKFDTLLAEIKALRESKSHDYADEHDSMSNLRRAAALGIEPWKGVLVRLTDKWSRIEQLASGKVPKHESLRDSLIDNAVYSLLAVILLEEVDAGRA